MLFLKNKKLIRNIYKIFIDLCNFKKEKRDILYKRNNHVPKVTLTKHTFDSISKDFFKLRNKSNKSKSKICFVKYTPLESDCAILNYAKLLNQMLVAK